MKKVHKKGNLASKSQVESPSSSSKTYLLVVPTVAPSNSEQSKRQAVGNLLLSDNNTSQFLDFFDDDQLQQKTLKRKLPTTVGPLSTQRLSHIQGRQKDQHIVSVRQLTSPAPHTSSPPSSNTSSSSSAPNYTSRISSIGTLTESLQDIENDNHHSFDIGPNGIISVSSSGTGSDVNSSSSNTAEVENTENLSKGDLSSWVKLDGMESDLVKDFDTNLSGLGLEIGANAYNMSEVLNLPIFKQDGLLSANQGLPPLQYMLCAPTSPATKVCDETLTYLNQGQSYEIKLKQLRDISNNGSMHLVKSQLRVVFHDRRLQYSEFEQFQYWKFSRPGDRLLNIDLPMSMGVIQPKEHPDHINLVEFVWDVDKEASVWVQVHCISTEFTARKHGGEKGVPFRIQLDTYTIDGAGEIGQHIHSASCQIKVFKPKGADRKQKTDKDKMEKRSAQEKLKYQPSYDSTLLSECLPIYSQGEEVDQGKELLPQKQQQQQQRTRVMEQASDVVMSRQEYSIIPHHNNGASSSYSDRRCRSVGSYNTQLNDSLSVALVPTSSSLSAQQTGSKPDLGNGGSSQQQAHHHQHHHSQHHGALAEGATVAQTQEWLQRQRFSAFAKTFGNFNGADLLTLSRDDLIQICGHADGIRLFNVLRAKATRPRLTLYLTPATETAVSASGDSATGGLAIYKAFYLQRPTVGELVKATGACIFEDQEPSCRPHISRVLYQPARSSIHVLVTDDVVAAMKDESSFAVSLIKNEVSSSFQVILKP